MYFNSFQLSKNLTSLVLIKQLNLIKLSVCLFFCHYDVIRRSLIIEESTCHEMVSYLSQRISSMPCFFLLFFREGVALFMTFNLTLKE